ncbi:CPBP family intramembrane metalloprotease [bacterium]|nr:CPBP family intramembrane metalloprotease [bacterium]
MSEAFIYPENQEAAHLTRSDRNLRWWTPVAMVGISLISFIFMSGVMAVAAVWVVKGSLSVEMLSDPSTMTEVSGSRLGLFLVVVPPQIALVLPSLIAAVLSPVPFRERLGLVRGNWPLWSWLGIAAATPLIGFLSGLGVGLFLEESETLKEMSNLFRAHGKSGFFIPLALMIGATPAFCEELLFRGYIQQRLTRSFRPMRGILIASTLFAAFHIDFVHVVAVFPLGVFLGWVTWRTGSIVPAMLGHFVNNFISVIGIVVSPEENTDTLGAPGLSLSLTVIAFGFVGIALIMVAASQDRLRSSDIDPQEQGFTETSPSDDAS